MWRFGPRAGEVGMNLQSPHIAHHEQRRVFQIVFILLELVERSLQIFVLALVFPAREAALPPIGPALPHALAATRHAGLESEAFTCRVLVVRAVPQQRA